MHQQDIIALNIRGRGWVNAYLLAVTFRVLIEAPVRSSSAPKAALGDQGERAELQVFGVFCTMPSHPPPPLAEVAQLSAVWRKSSLLSEKWLVQLKNTPTAFQACQLILSTQWPSSERGT